MRNINIEPFTLSDFETISDKLEKDFDNFWNINILKKEIENKSSVYLCCKSDNNIIGFAGITIVLDTAELNNIVIKKSERGKGFSSLLLEGLINIAKSKKCTKINLEVSSSNKIAINLYKKYNFIQVGLRPNYYHDSDAILMTLDI